MMKTENIRYVGALQDFGDPFAALYVDLSRRQLILFVLVESEGDDILKYVAMEISPDEVDDYMKNRKTLSEIVKGKKKQLAIIQDDKLIFSNALLPDLTESIESVDEFEPEYCDDDYWIKTFVNRIRSNKPLVVAG